MSLQGTKYLFVYPTQEQVVLGIAITDFRAQLRIQEINGHVSELPDGSFIVTLAERDDKGKVYTGTGIIDEYCAAMNLTKSQVIVCQLNSRCSFLDVVSHLGDK